MNYSSRSLPQAHWKARQQQTRQQTPQALFAPLSVEFPPDSRRTRRFAAPAKIAAEKTHSQATPQNRSACKQSARRKDSRCSTPRKTTRLSWKERAAPVQTHSTPRKSAPEL